MFMNETILLDKNDTTGKLWDEKLLLEWEWRRNGGRDWPGREQGSIGTEEAPNAEPAATTGRLH